MKIVVSTAVAFVFTLGVVCAYSQAPTFRYNFEYSCNGERVSIAYCRRDSDRPGLPRTRDDQNFCLVYYPDRPRRGGFVVQESELQADIVKKLQVCGAIGGGRSQTTRPGPSNPTNADNIGPEVAAANKLLLKGNGMLADDPTQARQYLDAAMVKYQAAIASGTDPYFANRGLGVIYILEEKYDLALPVWKKVISFKPDDPDDLAHLGISYYKLDRFPEAIAAFEGAVKASPKSAAFHQNLGSAYVEAGRLDDARREAAVLATLDPERQRSLLKKIADHGPAATSGSGNASVDPVAVAHYENGKKSYEAEEYVKAIPELEQAIAMHVDKYRLLSAYVYLGDSYVHAHQYAKAIASMPKALLIDKEATFYSILGDAYERTMQLPKALAAFQEAAKLKPKDAQVLASLGTSYALNRRIPDARRVYDTLLQVDKEQAKYLLGDIENEKGPAGILVDRAHIALLGQEGEEAVEWFHNALSLNPTNVDVLFDIGGGLEIYEKRDEALAVFRKILTLKLDPKQRGTTHYFIGQTYNNMKEYAKALPELIEANRLNPDYYAKNEIGITYLNIKQYPKALAAFQDAMKFKPDSGDTQFLIGQTYVEMGQPDNAVTAFNELIRIDPKNYRGYIAIGNIHYEQKKYPDAGRAYSSALKIDPKNKFALFGIGRTLLAVGRKPDAVRAYNTLKPLDADLAQKLLQEINKP